MGEPGWLPGAQAGVTGPANLPLLFTPTPTHRLPVSSPPARSPGRGALSPLAVTGSHSPLSGCPPLGLVQSWPEPAGVTVTGQKWKNGKIVWVLAVTLSPSDEGAAAGPSWSRLVPGPGRSLWLSDWDSERPYVQTGLKIPVPPHNPPPGRKGGPGNYCSISCSPLPLHHWVQSLGKGSGQGMDGVRGSYSGGAELPAPAEPGPACLVWLSAR